MLSFNTNCTHLVPIHIKITSVVTLERCIISKICSFSSTFVFHLSGTFYNATLHSKVNEVFASSPTSLQRCQAHQKDSWGSKVTNHPQWPLLCFSTFFSVLNPKTHPLHHSVAPSYADLSTPSSLTCTSINFFNFPNNLFLENGQNGVIFTYLFEHHPTVKLVAYLLEIIPTEAENKVNLSSFKIWWPSLNSNTSTFVASLIDK